MRKRQGKAVCEFVSFHPLVTALYYLLVIGVSMFSMDPLFLCATCAAAWGYAFFLKGKQNVRKNIIMAGFVLVLMTVVNTLFTHNGETVLFYINRNRVTLEAFLYGLCASVMLISVIMWLESFQILMTSDKLIYLFGKIAPVFGLVISMIFRFIPLLKARYAEIAMGQKCMGRGAQTGFVKRSRQLIKEVSILIAWSLEASIESADSMAARGYGLRGRSSFHLFKLTGRDGAALVFLVAAGSVAVAGAVTGCTAMHFYPRLASGSEDGWKMLAFAAFAALLCMPFIIEMAGDYKWKKSALKN